MNNKSTDEGKDRFAGAIGEDYDETFRLICPHLDKLEASVAEGMQPLFENSSDTELFRILDLGCGDGLTAKPILDLSENVLLFALDNEQQMLSQFSDNLSDYSSKCEIICEDALVYLRSVEDAFFDAIGSCFVIHNWNEDYRLQVLREIYRVTKPGGVFANADKLAEPRPRHEEIFLKQLTLVIDAYTEANRPDLLKEWVVHYLEDNIPGIIWFEAEAIKQLESIGFSSVTKTFRYDLEATLVAQKPY